MTYESIYYDDLKGRTLKGFSDNQQNLQVPLDEGYLAKLNEIEEKLSVANNTKLNYEPFNESSELKHREAVAFNGSFLHELHFGNSGADAGIAPEPKKTATLGGPDWAPIHIRRNGKLHPYFAGGAPRQRPHRPVPAHRAG